MCILPAPTAPATPHLAPARRLPPADRRQLALEALAGHPVTDLARQRQVSRKFVCRQRDRAHDALDHAFLPPNPAPEPVLFTLPVTTSWLRQLVLGLTLVCHSSLRGATELLADLFDYPLSVGTAHNILHQAVAAARAHNDAQDLSAVRLGAHDEIFQAGKPVLVGVDAHSTYCYLLSPEAHRDADTWGVRLLELQGRGFAPQATVADFAAGLRAGQAQALPNVPCRGDVFHALQGVMALVTSLEDRAYGAITACHKLARQQAASHRRGRGKDRAVGQKLRQARPAEAQAVSLAADVAVLARWLREDVLAVAGPDHATRGELCDFLVAELRAREPLCPHRIGPVRKLLENQREALLAFAAQLDGDLAALAAAWEVPAAAAREVLQVQALPACDGRRWQRERALWQQLGGRYHGLQSAVAELCGQVVRASSLVENLNGRLRGYFFLRRQLGADYLALLQFYLNHRRFQRSAHPRRVDQSPAELLTGQAHRHWLELLGYRRFSRS